GPTGSGKTTSLYAILKDLIEEPINIITIEDPVEYRIPEITQVEVNEQAGVTFASALKSFLRQDPDVILVGEIRDRETAQIAAHAAQTGHLVLSTLHSNNCFEALHRLQSLDVSGDDISSSLRLLISQRLVSKKCHCAGDVDDCPDCQGRGENGRIPLQETLPISTKLRKELSLNASISEIESIAVDEGFKSLRSHGLDMVKEKSLNLVELNSICPA
ncbi:MAG: Flp pilus assembly complex ATPase component, partial [Proteobacteria bacterium]|nr:Flp pilus assembly complex ATPase component [Pseudomonadota bacterium]